MTFPKSEQIRIYIKNKTEKLNKTRKNGAIRAVVVWAVALSLWALEYISGGEAMLLMLIAVAWASIERAISNLHIDTLSAIKRDVDRDLAEGLEGFESP